MGHHSFTTTEEDGDIDEILKSLPPDTKSSFIREAIRLNAPSILERKIQQAQQAQAQAGEALERIRKILADHPQAEATIEQLVAKVWPHWLKGQCRSKLGDAENLEWLKGWTTRPAAVLQELKGQAARIQLELEARQNPALDNFEEAQQVCRVCGCTDSDCAICIKKTGKPCRWVEPDLCSACVTKPKKKTKPIEVNKQRKVKKTKGGKK
jgi:hypothetical protein